MDNTIVHGLWIGTTLSKLELLTLSSFTNKGHQFHLWVYEPIETSIPTGVVIQDANSIIPKTQVFHYSNPSTLGHGKGSYAGFSDIFRYKLLYEKGGWWVDMDITCLKYFDLPESFFFRNHHNLLVVGNVMKCPQGSQVMLDCFEEAFREVDATNTDWHKPIAILEKNIKRHRLEKYILTDLCNPDKWFENTSKFVLSEMEIPASYFFIHWQNEAWRHYGFDKNQIKYKSTLARLMQEHGLLQNKFTKKECFKNRLYHSNILRNLRLLGVRSDE
ncbi:glycosyltransferase [Flavisolibacter tropicus]|uniref:glycosyltransferase n=1 Tax=Flavisolibacter tropicus TaxID=1492898 RepID=UPI000834C69F|nr:glycosyltransferase [Flavisolibacter tropicus]